MKGTIFNVKIHETSVLRSQRLDTFSKQQDVQSESIHDVAFRNEQVSMLKLLNIPFYEANAWILFKMRKSEKVSTM